MPKTTDEELGKLQMEIDVRHDNLMTVKYELLQKLIDDVRAYKEMLSYGEDRRFD